MTITKPCPDCGATLVRRVRQADGVPFLGCERWPECRHTEPIPLDQQLRAAGAPELPLFDPPAPEPDPGPAARPTRPPRLYPLPDKPPTTCRSCGARIVWATNPQTGAHVPLSLATETTDALGRRAAASHFTDCPHAKGWSKQA